jgi:hypothetical protein
VKSQQNSDDTKRPWPVHKSGTRTLWCLRGEHIKSNGNDPLNVYRISSVTFDLNCNKRRYFERPMSFLAMCGRLQNFISHKSPEKKWPSGNGGSLFFSRRILPIDWQKIRFHGQGDLAFPFSLLPFCLMIASHSGQIAVLFHQCRMYDCQGPSNCIHITLTIIFLPDHYLQSSQSPPFTKCGCVHIQHPQHKQLSHKPPY